MRVLLIADILPGAVSDDIFWPGCCIERQLGGETKLEGVRGGGDGTEEAIAEVHDFVAGVLGQGAAQDSVVEFDGKESGGLGEGPHCCGVYYVGKDAGDEAGWWGDG